MPQSPRLTVELKLFDLWVVDVLEAVVPDGAEGRAQVLRGSVLRPAEAAASQHAVTLANSDRTRKYRKWKLSVHTTGARLSLSLCHSPSPVWQLCLREGPVEEHHQLRHGLLRDAARRLNVLQDLLFVIKSGI